MATANVATTAVPTDPKELQKVLERAQRGDEATLPVLRELLKETRMVEACGNLAEHSERTLVHKFSGKDLTLREGLRRKLECLRAELAGALGRMLRRVEDSQPDAQGRTEDLAPGEAPH